MTIALKKPLLLSVIAAGLLMGVAPVRAEMAKPDPQMQAVLDALKELKAKPLNTLTVPEARTQASAADAARTVQRQKRISPDPEAKVRTKDISIPSATGNLPARVYYPDATGTVPIILYFHGGGFVVADLNTYDAAPRALALGTGAMVLSVDYRHAPEHKFPAAHEDAWTAYVWAVENAQDIGGDGAKIAVAGESAGANLAANVALMAKERKTKEPVYQLLVYPVAGNDTNTPSYQENATAAPLGKKDMEWFFDKVLASKDQASDPRLNLVGRADLAGLPAATIVTAQIDPLRSEGETYADKLKEAGVKVHLIQVDGVTHEFFGMGKVVDKAASTLKDASADVAVALKAK